MRYPFVEVSWVDAHSVAEWVNTADLPKLGRMVTRGWLVAQDEVSVTLAATLDCDADDQIGDVLVIPLSWVTIKVLQDG